MHSMALVSGNSSSAPDNWAGPAKGDRKALPLGAVLVQPPRDRASTTATATTTTASSSASGRSGAPATAAKPSLTVKGCPSTLPPPPPGPPVMVLFPATLHLSMFFVPPPPPTIASGALALLALLGSWVWGWGYVSAAGFGSGLAAGLVAGLGVRSRPLGGWSCLTLSVLGVALLGGGMPSTVLALELTVSTFWRHGWWLYLQPEIAGVLLMLSGATADVALGFLLSSLVQIYRTQPPQQPKSSEPQSPASAQHTAGGEGLWSAVTPPGLAGMRRRM